MKVKMLKVNVVFVVNNELLLSFLEVVNFENLKL